MTFLWGDPIKWMRERVLISAGMPNTSRQFWFLIRKFTYTYLIFIKMMYSRNFCNLWRPKVSVLKTWRLKNQRIKNNIFFLNFHEVYSKTWKKESWNYLDDYIGYVNGWRNGGFNVERQAWADVSAVLGHRSISSWWTDWCLHSRKIYGGRATRTRCKGPLKEAR